MIAIRKSPASFRDPSGFVFHRGTVLYRQVNHAYRGHYDQLVGSGLYRSLVDAGLLIPHEEVDPAEAGAGEAGASRGPRAAYKVLRPVRVPFISYPYEWSFSQLRDAAALTLEVQRHALGFGMALKDASAYNVQFKDGRPIFVDTLSFEVVSRGRALGRVPAVLPALPRAPGPDELDRRPAQPARADQHRRDPAGPGEHAAAVAVVAAALRCCSTSTSTPAMQAACADRPAKPPGAGGRGFSRRSLLGLIDHLGSAVRRLRRRPSGAGWADYYRKYDLFRRRPRPQGADRRRLPRPGRAGDGLGPRGQHGPLQQGRGGQGDRDGLVRCGPRLRRAELSDRPAARGHEGPPAAARPGEPQPLGRLALPRAGLGHRAGARRRRAGPRPDPSPGLLRPPPPGGRRRILQPGRPLARRRVRPGG